MLGKIKNYFNNYWREIAIMAIMIAIAAWFWLQGYGLDVPKTPNTTVAWFWLPGHGWLVPVDVYYQTAVVIITMYILLVAFRAERFVRRTSHEEELSLELAQKMSEIKGSAMMDVKKLMQSEDIPERIKNKIHTIYRLFDTRLLYANISESDDREKNNIKHGVLGSVVTNYFGPEVMKEMEKEMKEMEKEMKNMKKLKEFKQIINLLSQILFLPCILGFLAALDRSSHKEKDKLGKLYRNLKTVIMAFRDRLQNFSKGNKDSGEGDRLKILYEIESDMDKFVRSKQQGTDRW